MKLVGDKKDWRVRPIRAANGRVQGYAVEHRINDDNVWRETAFVTEHDKAMELATHMAYNFLVVT